MCKWKKTPGNTHFSILKDNSLKHKVNTTYYTRNKVALEYTHSKGVNTLHRAGRACCPVHILPSQCLHLYAPPHCSCQQRRGVLPQEFWILLDPWKFSVNPKYNYEPLVSKKELKFSVSTLNKNDKNQVRRLLSQHSLVHFLGLLWTY